MIKLATIKQMKRSRRMDKRKIKTLSQVRRIKKIDNVIFEGEIIKEIVDKIYSLEDKK